MQTLANENDMAMIGLSANIQYANREFFGNEKGYSYNDIALLPLLKSLSIQNIGAKNTFEGYSIWEIVCHLAFSKHLFSSTVDKNIETCPFEKGNEGFFSPALKSIEKTAVWLCAHDTYHLAQIDTLCGKNDELFIV